MRQKENADYYFGGAVKVDRAILLGDYTHVAGYSLDEFAILVYNYIRKIAERREII